MTQCIHDWVTGLPHNAHSWLARPAYTLPSRGRLCTRSVGNRTSNRYRGDCDCGCASLLPRAVPTGLCSRADAQTPFVDQLKVFRVEVGAAGTVPLLGRHIHRQPQSIGVLQGTQDRPPKADRVHRDSLHIILLGLFFALHQHFRVGCFVGVCRWCVHSGDDLTAQSSVYCTGSASRLTSN